jgi:periplasmic protein TonB
MLESADVARPGSRSRSALLSVAIHAALLIALAIYPHHAPRIAPFRLPGTAKGVTLLTYFSPGSIRPAKSEPSVTTRRATQQLAQPRKAAPKPQPAATEPPPSAPGTGMTGESGVGEGDIRIALLQTFHYPRPDLSVLPRGVKGDVVLNAVIDEHGKITSLTLLRGLAPLIDEAVMATVKQWLFTPATKDGVPVASEQELHFHYERG